MADILTRTDVDRIATLARLELTGEETELFATQLTAILAYADQVQQVDTSGVEPAAMIAALNDLQGVNVRNLEVDSSSGEGTEITVGLKTGVGVPLERMLGDLAGRDDVAAMSYDER